MQFDLLLWRQKRGLSQNNLAEMFGVNKDRISRWERGVTPMPKMLIMLIHYMNIPPSKPKDEGIYIPERDGLPTA